MSANSFTVTGVVCKTPRHTRSPAGVEHGDFVLEHRSQQQEDGMTRQAYCRIQVAVCGTALNAISKKLTLGNTVTVSGFINRHETRQGTGKLVLHAQHIEKNI